MAQSLFLLHDVRGFYKKDGLGNDIQLGKYNKHVSDYQMSYLWL